MKLKGSEIPLVNLPGMTMMYVYDNIFTKYLSCFSILPQKNVTMLTLPTLTYVLD